MEDIRKTFNEHLCNVCDYDGKRKSRICRKLKKRQQNKVIIYKCLNYKKGNTVI